MASILVSGARHANLARQIHSILDRSSDHGGVIRGRDKATLWLLAFYALLAFTLELYFVLHYRDIREQEDFLARLWSIYGDGDEAYFGRGAVHVPQALESLHIFLTQPLFALLAWAIVKDRMWRHPLQLAISSYLAYSVVFYFLHAAVSGFAGMPAKSWWSFFIFVTPNLPWLIGPLFMAHDSFTAIARKFQPTGLTHAVPQEAAAK
jgi:hypothetical protein